MTAVVLAAALAIATACAGGATAQQGPPAKPAPAAGVRATAPKPSGGDGNSGKPIEIVSDRLTVDQNGQIATFSGNVDAVQGTMSLRSDVLRVFYVRDEQGGGAQPAGGGEQSIRRIEAEGSVLVKTPTETAEGDRGVYDPRTRKVVLEGNVVLTRGQNVVRGTRLDSDLAAGISTVTAGPATAAKDGKQRVRALFVPEQQNGKGG
jgi:lipopolysaccharide export system protein LptA